MFHHSHVQWKLSRLLVGEPKHVECVLLMSRVEGILLRKPCNTAVFGQPSKFSIGQAKRFLVTYPRANQVKKCESLVAKLDVG